MNENRIGYIFSKFLANCYGLPVSAIIIPKFYCFYILTIIEHASSFYKYDFELLYQLVHNHYNKTRC